VHTSISDRHATLADVAKAVGCSAATVSRVLSKSSYPVSDNLRQRIEQAAEKLHYSPNLVGRMLKSGSSPFVGVVIPSLQNPYYMQLAMGIEQEASARGYAPLVLSSQRSAELERRHILGLLQKGVGCLLLISEDDSPEAVRRYSAQGGVACVFEANFPEQSNVLNARNDMFLTGRIAADYLLSRGHRSIAFLTTPLTRRSRQDTLDGCRFAMSKQNLPFSDNDVFITDFERETDDGLYEYKAGLLLATQLMAAPKRYTAVFALNDMVACGVMAGLREHNLRVPDDISVIGCDDIPFAVMMDPPLTTIRLSARLLGQRAVQLMINALETASASDLVTLSIRPELVKRASVRSCEGEHNDTL
jgi:LacI family transcriptional regulator